MSFETATFTPRAIPNVTHNPKYRDQECSGISIRVTERDRFEPVRTGVEILAAAKELFAAHSLRWRKSSVDRLAGRAQLRLKLAAGVAPEAIVESWSDEVKQFLEMRKPYLLY